MLCINGVVKHILRTVDCWLSPHGPWLGRLNYGILEYDDLVGRPLVFIRLGVGQPPDFGAQQRELGG